ncbi:hypothetical protein FOB58_003981 [Candida parapsilosis]|uniref:Uncharacterized protein n=2 Tax=Candida parapsilosis TaxID=5480 RepID=G8B9V7_CANPC|nr:uncharacterized protein CPAR2_303980 [Candida parapsilosis]KAF6044342.1 hypothetical protein FOB60_005435 [Candida parapsilosis]KAF6047903.1 hypothetical protein FOB58_003981 [Candida parapsilosis]KAF6050130.1 hypothetical protein FOB59_002376 [Candida parapsilosis]KAF6061250.1 hypothetical protein FOB61_004007 [Candida parapsilosis]KAI5904641.1 hypothetical protein K4G60_g3799 [Candida parapsilosis]
MSCNTAAAAVLPPANGKKLWRVKRSVSSSSSSHSSNSTQSQTSVECLNNSLKIAAAASKFSIRRPPMRRPKNKPGKPKDFVFVDLSPVKSDEEEVHEHTHMLETEAIAGVKNYTPPSSAVAASAAAGNTTFTPPTPFNEQLPSPTVSVEESIFDLPALNEYDEYDASHVGETTPTEELGLGIMNLDVDWNQPQPIQQQQLQQAPQQMAPPPPPPVPQMSQEYISHQLYGYQQAMLQQHLQIQQLQQQLFEQQQRAIESQIISATSTPALSQQPQFQLQSPLKEPSVTQHQQQGPSSLPVKKSRKTAGQLQFKTYQPKPKHQRSASEACIKKPVRKPHYRSNSVPFTPVQPQPQQQQQQYSALPMHSADSSCSDVSLDDFMMLNDQIAMNLNLNLNMNQNQEEQVHSSFTPVSEYSETSEECGNAGASKPSGITACGFEELFMQTYSNVTVKDTNNEFDLGSFVI